MERYYDTMRQMIMLTDTGIESLEYLEAKLKSDSDGVPMYLFFDFIEAFIQLCKAYRILEGKLMKSIHELEEEVAKGLITFNYAFKAGDMLSMVNLLDIHLIPAAKAYRNELAALLNPHILC